MISFRFRSNVKRIKIKTNKRLDERMSFWLQKVFNIKNQIVGFKSFDNKYYDVETFYHLIDKFYNSQVEIVEGTEQAQISFTSDNLNSSSFIRPSQPNTSEVNQKGGSSYQQQVCFVTDMRAFEKKLSQGKQISVLFDIHPGYKKSIVEGVGDIINPYNGMKPNIFILLNSLPPKKSNFSIYAGKNCVVVIPLTLQYKPIILKAIAKARGAGVNIEQNRSLKPQMEDEAPSFTTHHLQERLNQDACFDYLGRMNRDRMLSNYQYHKLLEKVQDNFSDFYKIFCDGVMDNDYESFKNQIRQKVENNLEMLLSNVEEMDLSRPISREQQRGKNLKKQGLDIEIVKVQNYFETLDLIKDRLDPKHLGEIKQHLLDQNQELCSYFSKFNARDYGKDELSKKLTAFAKERFEDLRPISRCVPRSKSTEGVRKQVKGVQVDAEERDLEEAPMFGSLNIQSQNIVSPIKNMSDMESIYKMAWENLADKGDFFSPEEYGLLYHYLQTKNDGILNSIQQLQSYEQHSLLGLKAFLREKMAQILRQNFNENEIAYLQSIKNNSNVSNIYDIFKYQCDIGSFISALREEINKNKIHVEKVLHKKSSDSQLLEKNVAKQPQKRKYSDQDQQFKKQKFESPQCSPRPSDMSLNQKGQEFSLEYMRLLANPWIDEFEDMLSFCSFRQPQKLDYLRSAYADYNPSLFLWVRQFIKNQETNELSAEYFRDHVQKKEYQQKGILKILPIYGELLRELVKQGKITQKMRQWAVMNFMECSLNVIGSFELYLLQKDEQEFVESLKMGFELQDKEMELYKTYANRIEIMLKEMCVNNEASLQIFEYYPQHIKSFIDVYYFTGNFEDLLENLHTLEMHHIQKSKASVATLNFSGINTSPFEYDDGSEMFTQINQNVKKLTPPGLTAWKIAKIDKIFSCSSRLSVAFNSQIDSINDKLLTKEEFTNLWRSKLDNWEDKEKFKATEEEISVCIDMDYTFYLAIVMYVYNVKSVQELQEKLKTFQAHLLNQFLAKQFNRPACQLQAKQNQVMLYLLHQNIDILFLQEAGYIDWKEELIPGYVQHKNHDSVVIYLKEKFGRIKPDLMEQYGKDLDFNNDTSFVFTDKNYLIVSAHLKAKEINREQAKEMFKTLKMIKEAHPLIRIVIGMDANHFLEQENLMNEEGRELFFMAPDNKNKPTTVKKRTYMQAQYSKAGVLVEEVKDHVVSTHKIVEWSIQKITGAESTDELLPNDEHPYDHYLVRSIIKFL